MPVSGYVSAINGQLYCCETPTSSSKPICIFLQEYFTECHWKKLPISWQAALSKISLQEFCHQMFEIEPPLNCVRLTQIFLTLNFFFSAAETPLQSGVVLPLSLLAFSATAGVLAYPYTVNSACNGEDRDGGGYGSQITGLSHIFRRHVKPKKQHEIKELGKVCGRKIILTFKLILACA